MISALSFVPAGVADKNPKRYELSTTERELLAAMEEQEEEQQQQSGEASKDNANPKSAKEKRKRGTFKVNLPDTPPATSTSDLPADLRMDEYSDDDEDDAGGAIGQLLMDQPATMAAEYMAQQEGEEDEDDDDDDNNSKQATLQMADPDSDGDDEDDDLADVPDTREFTPVNVDGLDAMRLYDVGMGAGADMEDMDFDEDDSEAEDVKLSDDDALILVTKTEDVRDCIYTLERRSTHQFLSPHPISSHFFWFHLVYISNRTFLHWKYMFMIKSEEHSMFTTIFHYPRFQSASPMGKLAQRELQETIVLWEPLILESKFGTWMF